MKARQRKLKRNIKQEHITTKRIFVGKKYVKADPLSVDRHAAPFTKHAKELANIAKESRKIVENYLNPAKTKQTFYHKHISKEEFEQIREFKRKVNKSFSNFEPKRYKKYVLPKKDKPMYHSNCFVVELHLNEFLLNKFYPEAYRKVIEVDENWRKFILVRAETAGKAAKKVEKTYKPKDTYSYGLNSIDLSIHNPICIDDIRAYTIAGMKEYESKYSLQATEYFGSKLIKYDDSNFKVTHEPLKELTTNEYYIRKKTKQKHLQDRKICIASPDEKIIKRIWLSQKNDHDSPYYSWKFVEKSIYKQYKQIKHEDRIRRRRHVQ
jgi:hypothetical protein